MFCFDYLVGRNDRITHPVQVLILFGSIAKIPLNPFLKLLHLGYCF